jgi:hypothetical protein
MVVHIVKLSESPIDPVATALNLLSRQVELYPQALSGDVG